jgi:hypothetical protein
VEGFAGPAKSSEVRKRGGILHAEDFETLTRKFGNTGNLWYVYSIKIKICH